MWIVIIALATLMVLSITAVYVKQKRAAGKNRNVINRERTVDSLITVEDKYQEEYINRTSADPNSIRGTIDLGLTDSLLEKETTQENLQSTPMVREENEKE